MYHICFVCLPLEIKLIPSAQILQESAHMPFRFLLCLNVRVSSSCFQSCKFILFSMQKYIQSQNLSRECIECFL